MVLIKTETGLQVLKDRSVALTPRQRSAFIMFDGKRTVDEVLSATQAMGIVRSDVDRLLEFGLLRARSADGGAPGQAAGQAAQPEEPADAALAVSGRTPQQRYQEAYPIATRLTAQLGLRGFRLNLAVEAVSNYEQLLALAPKLREAVGEERYAELDRALNG